MSHRIVRLNNRGLSLIEVMVAMVVFLLVSLALMQTALLSIDSNMRNLLRDEAVNIAEMRINESRNIDFDTLATDTNVNTVNLTACQSAPFSQLTYPVAVARNFRGITGFSYGTQRTVTTLDADNKSLTMLVRWDYKNECSEHRVSTIVRRP
ncbi:MAG: prepilin-type N-terminal cleavage/methylation domain-containing protein [Nitrospirae bacterium]|nr:prepilin-type N-terminal cleavage/methylation domain-containing protein [Nitrospirota bacterium]